MVSRLLGIGFVEVHASLCTAIVQPSEHLDDLHFVKALYVRGAGRGIQSASRHAWQVRCDAPLTIAENCCTCSTFRPALAAASSTSPSSPVAFLAAPAPADPASGGLALSDPLA